MSDPDDEAPASDAPPAEPADEPADTGLITKGESERLLGRKEFDPNRSTFDRPRDEE